MYMVVDIRWDDYAPEDEIVQMQDPTKDFFQNNNALPISPSRKRLYQNHNLLKTHQRLYLDDQILCWRTNLRSNVEQLAVLKLLITKITKPNPKYKSIPAAIPTAENHGRHAKTEN